jgi:hypothetical protein
VATRTTVPSRLSRSTWRTFGAAGPNRYFGAELQRSLGHGIEL